MDFRILILVVFLNVIYIVGSENLRAELFMKENCKRNEFQCLNNHCIPKHKFCNNINDCIDNSDENFCYTHNECPTKGKYIRCNDGRHHYRDKCVPHTWMCDGHTDCAFGEDERDCSYNLISPVDVTAAQIAISKGKAMNWLMNQSNNESTFLKWGTDLRRKSVALYLGDPDLTMQNKTIFQEFAVELNSMFLSTLALRKIEDVPTSDLVSFLNAFLVTCIDPRKFYIVNIVEELRKRIDAMNSTIPFALLALCNAQDTITYTDVQKLLYGFGTANRNYKTDIQAVALMALSCAAKQPDKYIDQETLSEFAQQLKRKQARNGTVDNIKTTALTLQALFASEPKADEDNFDERKALFQLLRSQERDGSFGGITNTYYILPVLNYFSLINISSTHCPEFKRNRQETLLHLKSQVGDKIRIKYSILIGDRKTLQQTLTLNVHKNDSFFEVMEYASGLEDIYKFKYNIRDRKPYIYSLADLMDDPESEIFWNPYYMTDEEKLELKQITKSPADIIPQDKDHIVYWYKKDT